jgi:ABC-type lipoprotein release transport system permease subunit
LIETNMAGFFPYFATPVRVMGIAPVGAALTAVVASIVPAWRASHLKVTDALRRLD